MNDGDIDEYNYQIFDRTMEKNNDFFDRTMAKISWGGGGRGIVCHWDGDSNNGKRMNIEGSLTLGIEKLTV